MDEIFNSETDYKGKHVMAVMGKEGDLKTIWSKDEPDEVAAAKKQFEEMTGKGYVAFKVEGKAGDKGEIMRTFDPNAERVILCPPLKGG